MKNNYKWFLVSLWLVMACTPQQMRMLEQSLSCQTASMTTVYHTKSSCGFPYPITGFVKNLRYGKEMNLADGAPAPLLNLTLSAMPDGSIPVLHTNRIWLDLKRGRAEDRRALYCTTNAPKTLKEGETFLYGCDFEDGEVLVGEYVVSELSFTSDRCDEPVRYTRSYDTGSEALCMDYGAPAGYPLLRLTDSVRIAPIDQRKLESAWSR